MDLLSRRLVGTSPEIEQVRSLIVQASTVALPVLLIGETGTGKDLCATEIARLSDTPAFFPVNMAEIPEALADSELFGHERGAFTGAVRDRVGLLRRAHRGTLFLDEFTSLPPTVQAKLLRVVEDGEVRPLGGGRSVRIRTRLIVALNADPRELLATGALRNDLFFRLRGLEIRLPPLRDRIGDLHTLISHFLDEDAGAPARIHPSVLSLLAGYAWPGNVRELRAAIRRAVVEARDEGETRELRAEHFRGTPELFPRRAGDSSEPQDPANAHLLATHVEIAERTAILSALQRFRWHRQRTATHLGISVSTLARRIRRYGLFDGGRHEDPDESVGLGGTG